MPVLALCTCLLNACGGGGGGGGGAAVSPVFPLGSAPSPTPQDLTTLPLLTELNVAFRSTASLIIGDGQYFVNLASAVPRVGVRTSAGDIAEIAVSVPGLFSQSFTNPQLEALDNNVAPAFRWASQASVVGGRDITVDIIDPAAGQLQYHTFGTWGYELSTSFQLVVGYVVLGTPTPASGIPSTGTATYTGVLSAIYSTAAGGQNSLFDVTSVASATADFNTIPRSIVFSTTGTVRQSLLDGDIDPAANLNLSGTFTIAPGSNSISGSITAANGLSGTATGSFFGPAGQEIGGSFDLSRNAGTPSAERMFGAFGLHR